MTQAVDHGRRRVCFPFVGDSVGGSHISAALLLRHLRPPFEPLVIVHQEGPLSAYLDAEGIDYRLLPLRRLLGGSSRPSGHLRDLAATFGPIRRCIRDNGIAVVHPQDGRMNLSWALPARQTGCRFVWHQRSKYAPSQLMSLFLRAPQRIVCVSRFVANSLPRHSARRHTVIDDPHDTGQTPPDRTAAKRFLSRALGTGPETPVVGCFGNLTAQKRPEMFLRAAAGLTGRHGHDAAFALFGADRDGLEPGLRELADRLGLTGRVHFMGFRTPAEDYMAGCDLILAPGVNDAFPRVLIEAMLCGTPLVATASGGHLDILNDGETGLLVAPDDADGLAAAAAALIGDPARRQRLADRAGAAARRRYSVDKHVSAIEAVYADVLGPSTPSGTPVP